MPTELRNLRIGEVSLVDKGAGKGVRITLTKRREPQESKKSMKTVEQILATLSEEDQKILLAAIEAAKKPSEPTPEQKSAAEPPAGVSPTVKAAWPTLSEDLRKIFREQAAAEAEKVEKARKDEEAKRIELEKRIAESEEREEKREFVEKAAAFKHVPVLSRDELADCLRHVAKGRVIPEALRPKVEQMLKSVDELVAKSALLGERGSLGRGGDDSPMGKLQGIAKQLREKDPKLSEAASLDAAMRANPTLYREHVESQRAPR